MKRSHVRTVLFRISDFFERSFENEKGEEHSSGFTEFSAEVSRNVV